MQNVERKYMFISVIINVCFYKSANQIWIILWIRHKTVVFNRIDHLTFCNTSRLIAFEKGN